MCLGSIASANIGSDGVASGNVIVPYLPPVPPRGSGFHRMVFALYRHTQPLDPTQLKKKGGDDW